MPQGGERHGPDVLPGHVRTAPDQRVDLGAQHHRLDAARARADADVASHGFRGTVPFGPRREPQPDRVVLNRARHRRQTRRAPHRDHLLRRPQRRGFGGVARGRAVEDRVQVFGRRIGHSQLEQEAVELRFRQGVGALHLQRVLGGEHEERRIEAVRFSADRDRRLLHRLEQGGLGLRRGAVDLVGEQQVREDGAGFEDQPAASRLVLAENVGADDVRGHQVGRELDAVELQMQRLGQGADQAGLAEAGDALEQDVPVGQQADDRPVDDFFLAHDHLADLAAQAAAAVGELGQLQGKIVRGARLGGVVHSPSSSAALCSASR